MRAIHARVDGANDNVPRDEEVSFTDVIEWPLEPGGYDPAHAASRGGYSWIHRSGGRVADEQHV